MRCSVKPRSGTMVLQDSRVSNPPPPEPSTSTSERTVDASYSLGPSQPGHVLSPTKDSISERDAAGNPQASIPPVSISTSSGIFGFPEDVQTRVVDQTGGTRIDSHAPINDTSVWTPESLLFGNSVFSGHPMAVLRNRVVGLPTLAPAPTPHKPAPVARTSIEASRPSAAQLEETKTTAQALVNLAPKPNNKSNDNQVAPNAQAQQYMPLPASGPAMIPTAAPKQQASMNSPSGKTPAKSRKRRNRRKRPRESDDEIKANDSSSDGESDDMLPMARQTKSGRQVNRPTYFAPSPEPKQSPRQRPSPSTTPASGAPVKRRRKVYRKNGKDINITCTQCQRGHSPATNSIVFCDECNGAWHQFCHEPPISKQLIDDKDAEWFCRDCRPGQRVTLLKLRLPRKAEPISTKSSPAPLICGSQFTPEEQRGYLSSLSHAALVDMLVTLSRTNPELPVFPENLKDLPQSKFAVTPTSTTNTSNQTPQSTSAKISKDSETGIQVTESVAERPKDVESTGAKQNVDQDSDDSGSEYEVEEHRLYPRPGNGFCLPPEEEDLDILLDDPACSTFSYTLHSYSQTNALADNKLAIKVGG